MTRQMADPKIPDFRNSGILDFRKSRIPEIWVPGIPELRTSGNPDFRNFRTVEIWDKQHFQHLIKLAASTALPASHSVCHTEFYANLSVPAAKNNCESSDSVFWTAAPTTHGRTARPIITLN